MKDVWLFLIHLLTTAAQLLGPGGVKGIIAENPLLKQQLLVVCRPRQRAPNLTPANRFLLGVWLTFSPDQPHHENGYAHSAIDAVEIS